MIDLTRISNDTNGNPRYVCHFTNLTTDKDRTDFNAKYPGHITSVNHLYTLALKRAKSIGGRKYNTKAYGGGIVFQSYNVAELEKSIIELTK